MEKLTGTGVALVTPFNVKGEVDYVSLEKLTEHVITGGVEYLVPLGTTGESVTLNKDEKIEIVNTVIRVNNKRIPVVLGLGGNNTAEIISTIRSTDFNGISALLSVSPYYNKPSQAGLYEHYKLISETSPVPVILYNVPGRTSSNLTAETTLKLARDCKNIPAIKEASANFDQFMKIIKDKPDHFMLISGDDNYSLPVIAAGASGVISVVANVFPKQYSGMVRLCLEGKFEEARKIHYLLFDFINLLFTDGNPAGIKAALNIAGICENYFRLPLVPGSSETYSRLSVEMKKIMQKG